MNKQSMTRLLTGFVFVVFVCSLPYCQKSHPGSNIKATSSDPLLQEAQAYFEANYAMGSPDGTKHPTSADSLPYGPANLHKTPLWGLAQVQSFSFGQGVVTPVQIAETITLHPQGQSPVPLSTIGWLFMYKNAAGQWQTEFVIHQPAASSGQPAETRVESWTGLFLRAYQYKGDSTWYTTTSQTFQQDPALRPKAPTLEAPGMSARCTTTDWYACTSIGDGPTTCEYVYSTEECTSTLSSSASSQSGATASSTDYAIVGGGTGGASAPATASIQPQASITSNPIIACVWTHLMNKQLINGLASILSNFADNQVYNVTFTLSDTISGDGMTRYLGNNNFLIQINAQEATDSDYSRIYLASTFIHEAFHAQLRQKALALFGEAEIAKWPKNIDDMTLAQLASYFEAESKTENIWESVEHDWMVDNIETLAMTLQSFVKTYYKSTYASAGSDIQTYEALMYMGLQNSTLYQEDIVNSGLQTNLQAAWGKLNEGGKCQN